MKKQLFVMLLVAAALFVSCVNKKEAVFNFDGKTIQLVELGGVAYDSTTTAVPVYLTFDADGSDNLNGSAGCNSIFGSYSIDDHKVKFGPLGMTRRMCDEVSNKVEADFAKALESADNYKFADGRISFFKGEELLLVFEEK